MPTVARRGLLVALAATVAGCTGGDGTPAAPGGGDGTTAGGDATTTAGNPALGEVTQMGDLELTSPAFDDGGSIPQKYGKSYENVNPPLRVSGRPDGTATLVLVVDDPEAPSGVFDHWLAWNIPADTAEIPEGWDPPPAVVQGTNGFGNVGYDGPRPPEAHTYRFKAYAIDTSLDVERGADKETLGEAMRGHVLSRTQLDGTFTP